MKRKHIYSLIFGFIILFGLFFLINSSNKLKDYVEIDNKKINVEIADSDKERQKELINVIVGEFLKDSPMVPLFFNPVWFEYSTENFTGWPSEDNPYTAPSTAGMSKMPVFLNLEPVE